MKDFIYYLQYLFLRGVCFLINWIPFPIAMAAGRGVGHLLYWLLPGRRRITLENLRRAFGKEKSGAEIEKIAKQAFENLGMIAVEFIRIPRIARDPSRYMRFDRADFVWEALKEGKGAIFVVSHFGNWEWMAIAAGAVGLPIHAVARPLRNPYVYRYIKKLRGATGLQSINKHGAARETIKLLAQNQIVCLLIDQHERQGSVRPNFFGREASTTTLPAILAVKRGVPVLPVFFYRASTGASQVLLGKPFPIIKTGNYERDVFENTQQYMKRIEEVVRDRPGDWLWMHRRWRTK